MHAMEAKTMAMKVAQSWRPIPKVKVMGKFKFLYLASQEEVKEVLSMELNPLCSDFDEMRKWAPEVMC